MSVSGPSPLGTLMVQRVEAALGATLAQQANITTGARPDAVTQPGQPDKADPAKNPPPKGQEGARRAHEQGGRQGGLAALARNDPEIAKLLAARNAPMTAYTASAPTTLGQAAKTILALLQYMPDARPAVPGRAPLLAQPPGHGTGQGVPGQGQAAAPAAPAGPVASTAPTGSAAPAQGATAGSLDPGAVQAPAQRPGGESGSSGAGPGTAPQAGPPSANAEAAARAATAASPGTGASPQAAMAGGAGSAALPGQTAQTGPAPAPGAAWATTTAAPGPAGSHMPLPAGVTGQLARALSQALQGSGLFYESHLRDFTFGQRSLGQVRAEPQAHAGQDTPGRAVSAESAQARGGAETAPGQSGQSSQPGQSGQASQTTQAAHTGQNAGTQLAGALLALDPSTHVLVRQQLETLANQTFAWQGEAWPGSDLEWEVQRREHPGTGPDEDHWATRLKLNLPGLGEVQARLSLSGSQLLMHLLAPGGAALMADHTDLLRQRLGAQGLQLSQLTISRETPAGDEAP